MQSAELLTAVVFLPAFGAALLALFPAEDHTNLKGTAFGVSLVTFVASVGLWVGFDPSAPGYQYSTEVPWIDAFGVWYATGVDGISLTLLVLTTFLMPLTLLGAWTAVRHRVKEFVIACLLLETGMLGAFVALDLFLFYVFWEAMLIPMYFIIGIWGGQRRIYAAIKFFIFTMAGSLLMLVAILYIARGDGDWSFLLADALGRDFGRAEQGWLFAAFALAFAIKVPMFPVHTWLPDAHVEAPTAGSVILAGILLKLGVYGFIRFAMPLFPIAAVQALPVIGWLSVVGIIYGALLAWVQPDMKKLVAYSSVSHLGFCMLGLAALTTEGVAGSVFVMVAHGVSTGALFLLVGVLYERRHTRALADYGGVAKRMPIYAFSLVFIAMASAGLPALSGFPGEFLVLLGTFTAGAAQRWWAIAAAVGVILAAVYLLWMVQRVLLGPLQNPANEELKDMTPREIVVVAPLMVLAVILGLQPSVVLDPVAPAVSRFVQQVHREGTGRTYRPPEAMVKSAVEAPVAIPTLPPIRLAPAPVAPARSKPIRVDRPAIRPVRTLEPSGGDR